MRARSIWLLTTAALVFGPLSSVHAQDKFPSRFVKIVTTTGTGTGPDVITRVVAEALGREWGQQVVVENNSTGGGMVAAKLITSGPADGYTLLGASASTFNVLPIRQADAPVVVGTHLKPIAYFGDQPLVIAVSPTLGVNSIKELVDLAKRDPDKVLYAANVSGTLPHMTGEVLKSRTEAPYRFVPYRGGAEGLKDVLSGSINMIIDGYAALEGTIKSGHIKPIAVTSKSRISNLPDVPPAGDTVPGFVSIGWNALAAPVGVPDAIINQINADMRRVMEGAEIKKRLADLGAYPVSMTVPELTAFIKSEQEQWWPVVRQILATPAPAPAATLPAPEAKK
jgi:tripartite-type tricarboxylate transporter receptor subunit TctC